MRPLLRRPPTDGHRHPHPRLSDLRLSLVIDGFIAYGVRALLVLRTAPLAARCYVWLLFATATAASIWANALHAVRLNEQRPERTGLRLGDITVGVLSTLAPLALAGAVHLYILIARRVAEAAVTGTLDNQSAWSGRDGTVAPDIVPIATDHVSADNVRRPTVRTPATEVSVETNTVTALIEASEHSPVGPEAERPDGAADLDGQSVTKPPPVTILPPAKAQETFADTIRARRPDNRDQKPTAVTDDELLDIARTAVHRLRTRDPEGRRRRHPKPKPRSGQRPAHRPHAPPARRT